MDKTPQTEAATNELLGSDEKIEEFKRDPSALLAKHNIATPEEHENLKAYLAGHDTDSLKMTLSQQGLHTMFSQKS